MKLEKLTIKNFRCFKDIEVKLHPKTTVLVANNGQGKSSILDAIRIALWPYVSQFDLAKTAYADPANTITIDDVRTIKSIDQQSRAFGALDEMARQFTTSVTASGEFDSTKITWQRFRDSEAKKSQTKDDKASKYLKVSAKNLQQQVRDLSLRPIDLPVFGYYGTGRLWREKRLTDGKKGSTEKNNEQIRTFAYRDCLDPASSFRQFEDWFTSAYIKVMQHQIRQIEQGATFLEVDPALKRPVKVIQEAVNAVLKPVHWQNLQYSETYDKSLVLKHTNLGVMKVSQLSDGIKNMLSMIADIAYRCVLLNGHLGEEAAKQSSGIVMIDEIDMHLHPVWQQSVISSLQEAFPNIQFIVTTHSPQVLSTVPKECIRVLGKSSEGDDIAAVPLAASYGEPSNDVLQAIMHVDPQPPVPEKDLLDELTSLVDQGEYQSSRALELLAELKQKLNDQHPQILKIERSIRRQKVLKG
jgi:predicted ATP-binding protein involved in virulence